jgi:hypothetical protein
VSREMLRGMSRCLSRLTARIPNSERDFNIYARAGLAYKYRAGPRAPVPGIEHHDRARLGRPPPLTVASPADERERETYYGT